MTKSRNILAPRHAWTESEIEILKRDCANNKTSDIAKALGLQPCIVYSMAAKLGLRKSPEFLKSQKSGRLSSSTGELHRFKKGHVPFNKGIRQPGYSPGNMSKTQFKKGEIVGAAAKKLVPVGTEIIDRAGYTRRKVRDDAPPNFSRFNWVFAHVALWVEHLGPVPKGFKVIFKNGDKSDIRIDNLALVSHGELMRRNSYHGRYPKELTLCVQLRGQITRQINKRLRNEKQNHRPA